MDGTLTLDGEGSVLGDVEIETDVGGGALLVVEGSNDESLAFNISLDVSLASAFSSGS
jgi:hypothetical protein